MSVVERGVAGGLGRGGFPAPVQPLSLFVSVCLAADAADVVVSHIKK